MAILGSERVEGVELVRNHLARDADGTLRARPTEQHETLEAGIVFRSIGYRGRPLAGVPFDERSGTIPNDAGRILDPHTQHHIAGEYAVGWIKRGPTGVIGTNKRDAQETIELLLDDLAEERLPSPGSTTPESILELLAERGVRVRRLRGLGGDRRTREGRRRAAGTPAGQARHVGRAARGVQARGLSTGPPSRPAR